MLSLVGVLDESFSFTFHCLAKVGQRSSGPVVRGPSMLKVKVPGFYTRNYPTGVSCRWFFSRAVSGPRRKDSESPGVRDFRPSWDVYSGYTSEIYSSLVYSGSTSEIYSSLYSLFGTGSNVSSPERDEVVCPRDPRNTDYPVGLTLVYRIRRLYPGSMVPGLRDGPDPSDEVRSYSSHRPLSYPISREVVLLLPFVTKGSGVGDRPDYSGDVELVSGG